MDRYGRITIDDGLHIAQGLRVLKQDSIEQEAFAVADKLYKGKGEADLTGHRPEAQVRGAGLYWEMGTKELQQKSAEMNLSTDGMRKQVEQFKLQKMASLEQAKIAEGLIKAGKPDAAKEVYRQMFNSMPNGRFVQTKDGGQLEVTNWDMSKIDMEDPTIEQYQEVVGAYLNMPLEEQAKAFASGSEVRRQKNMEMFSKAEPFMDPQSGRIAYLVPAGTWGPDNKPRGAFFVDGPTENAQEIPQDQAANLIPLSAYKKGSAGTTQERNFERAQQDPAFAAFLNQGKGGRGGRGGNDGNDYLQKPGNMLKETHTYWGARIKGTDDPTEQRAYQQQYDADLKRVAQGQMPSFFAQDQQQGRGDVVASKTDPKTGKVLLKFQDGSTTVVEPKDLVDGKFAGKVPKKIPPLQPKSQDVSVRQRGQKFYKVTDQGEVEMTPEEIKEWQASSGVIGTIKDAFGLRAPGVNKGQITGTHTPKHRGY